MHFNIRRVYKGLLNLLDANSVKKGQESTSNTKKSSRKPKKISELVTHIALGSQIKSQGNLSITKSMYSFHALSLSCMQFLMTVSRLPVKCLRSTYKLDRCGPHLTYS